MWGARRHICTLIDWVAVDTARLAREVSHWGIRLLALALTFDGSIGPLRDFIPKDVVAPNIHYGIRLAVQNVASDLDHGAVPAMCNNYCL